MKAIFKIDDLVELDTDSHRKAEHFYRQYTGITHDFTEILIMKIYAHPETSYACLWIEDKDLGIFASGSGKSGGKGTMGKHKASVAAKNAINEVGIFLDHDINSFGAIKDAMSAIMSELSYRSHAIVEALP